MIFLPQDVKNLIGTFLSLSELYQTMHLLKIHPEYLQFPLSFPTKKSHHLAFGQWLLRRKHLLSDVHSIHIKFLLTKYCIPIIEILGQLHIKNVTHLTLINVLNLFDTMNVRLCFALRHLLYQCLQLKYLTADARIIGLCILRTDVEFSTFVTWGSKTTWTPEHILEKRKTNLSWVHHLVSPLQIKCCCLNHSCHTFDRIPSTKRYLVSILHSPLI